MKYCVSYFDLECTLKPSRQFCATANFGKDAAVGGQKKSMAHAQEFSAGNSKIMTKKPLYLCNVTTCDLLNGLFCVIQFPESTLLHLINETRTLDFSLSYDVCPSAGKALSELLKPLCC